MADYASVFYRRHPRTHGPEWSINLRYMESTGARRQDRALWKAQIRSCLLVRRNTAHHRARDDVGLRCATCLAGGLSLSLPKGCNPSLSHCFIQKTSFLQWRACLFRSSGITPGKKQKRVGSPTLRPTCSSHSSVMTDAPGTPGPQLPPASCGTGRVYRWRLRRSPTAYRSHARFADWRCVFARLDQDQLASGLISCILPQGKNT